MTSESRERWSKILWAALLVCLPVTSFKYIPLLGSGTYVRPLAIYPMVLLLSLLALRLVKKEIKNPVPSHFLLVGLFVLAILTSSAIGGINIPVPLGGVTYFDRIIRSLVTLVVGLGFYISATWMNQDEEDVSFSVRWLMVGLGISLIWAVIQFVGLNTGHRSELTRLQSTFSIRGLVKNKRVSGFAFEPSWLAGQLATIYLPWLVASFIQNFKPWKTSLINKLPGGKFLSAWIDPINICLLGGSILVLFFTYSRSGLAIVLAGFVITYLLAGNKQVTDLRKWLLSGMTLSPGSPLAFGNILTRVALILLVVAILTGAGFFLADKGYIAAFFQTDPTSITEYIQKAYLGPRFAYLGSALTAYQHHPIFGVGFGASGFWIYQNMPDWSLAGNPEIALQLSPSTNIFPNPKNILVRLLAETGIIGFSIYLVFLTSMFAIALKLLRFRDTSLPGGYNWIGTAGIFGLVTILLLGFSIDSVAMPEIWILPGILTGVISNKGDEI